MQQHVIRGTNQENNGTLPTNTKKLVEDGGKGRRSFGDILYSLGNPAYFQGPYEFRKS